MDAISLVASEISDAIAAHDSGEQVNATERARHVVAALTVTVVGAGERDWPEDFSHENGTSQSHCTVCGGVFRGRKCRGICRRCAAPSIGDAPSTVERVAEALCDEHGGIRWAQRHSDDKRLWRERAREVLGDAPSDTRRDWRTQPNVLDALNAIADSVGHPQFEYALPEALHNLCDLVAALSLPTPRSAG